MQAITYKHWLALIIGDEGIKKMGVYRGYQANVDPSISNVFAASAFRFGHTRTNKAAKSTYNNKIEFGGRDRLFKNGFADDNR